MLWVPTLRHYSTFQTGLAYERLVVQVLRGYSFQLVHTGRTGDRGTDFLGHWLLPGARRVPVIGQCKHRSQPLGPADVREFEGVLRRKGGRTVGILTSHSRFSSRAVETFLSCRSPMILCQVKPDTRTVLTVDSRPADTATPLCQEENSTPEFLRSELMGDEVNDNPRHLSSPGGHIQELLTNSPAMRLLPGLRVEWSHGVWGGEGEVAGGRREVVLLWRGEGSSYRLGEGGAVRETG